MIDWTVNAEYNVGEGWQFEATLDLDVVTVKAIGAFNVTAAIPDWPVDVEVENHVGKALAQALPKQGLRVWDLPGLYEAIASEETVKEARWDNDERSSRLL